jgi:hypothetical protein
MLFITMPVMPSVYAGQYPKNGVTVAEICGLDGK